MSLSLKGWAYLVATVLLVVLILWGCIHLVHVGETRQTAKDEVAVKEHDKQVQAQHNKDLKDANDVIKDLKGKLAGVAVAFGQQPLNPIVVHRADEGHQGCPTRITTGGAQPGAVAVSSPDTPVLGGSGAGVDVAADVRTLATAGAVLATYNQQLWDWAVKQAQPIAAPH